MIVKKWSLPKENIALSQFYSASSSSKEENFNMIWSSEAITTLYHFMRCSQLEYGHGMEGQPPIQVRILT